MQVLLADTNYYYNKANVDGLVYLKKTSPQDNHFYTYATFDISELVGWDTHPLCFGKSALALYSFKTVNCKNSELSCLNEWNKSLHYSTFGIQTKSSDSAEDKSCICTLK